MNERVQYYGKNNGKSGPVEIHINNGPRNTNGEKKPVTPVQTSTTQNTSYGESVFDGGLLGLIGISILQWLLIVVTLGIGFPWAVCMKERWYAEHTVIEGRQLAFDGTGLQLLGNYLKWGFFTIITLGVYSLWVPLKMKAWIVSHTYIVD